MTEKQITEIPEWVRYDRQVGSRSAATAVIPKDCTGIAYQAFVNSRTNSVFREPTGRVRPPR